MSKTFVIIAVLTIVVMLYAFGIIPPVGENFIAGIIRFFKTIDLKSDVMVPAIIGMISSATVSAISYSLFVKFMRPSLEIGSKIACSRFGDINEYHIKVINRSRCEAAGVRAELHLISSRNAGNGKIARSQPIKLIRSDPMNLASFKVNDVMCATRFITKEPLEELWDDEFSSLRLLIHCTHANSNLGKTFYKEFYRKTHTIVNGEYEVGTSFEIMPYEADLPSEI